MLLGDTKYLLNHFKQILKFVHTYANIKKTMWYLLHHKWVSSFSKRLHSVDIRVDIWFDWKKLYSKMPLLVPKVYYALAFHIVSAANSEARTPDPKLPVHLCGSSWRESLVLPILTSLVRKRQTYGRSSFIELILKLIWVYLYHDTVMLWSLKWKLIWPLITLGQGSIGARMAGTSMVIQHIVRIKTIRTTFD